MLRGQEHTKIPREHCLTHIKTAEMNADEFAASVQPGKKTSRMEPFLADLQRLRADGYTLVQLQEFLRLNKVTISVGWLGAFLKHRENTEPSAPKKTQPARKAPRESPAAPSETDDQAAHPEAHSPDALDKIIRTTPDLDALAKLGKPLRSRK